MIKYMDFSFEKAFDKKEKDFMLAYRVYRDLFHNIESHFANSRRDRNHEKRRQ